MNKKQKQKKSKHNIETSNALTRIRGILTVDEAAERLGRESPFKQDYGAKFDEWRKARSS